jgi:hypothetical protein
MGNRISRAIATIAAAAACSYWAYLNHGTSGIGWFLFSLVVIWGY